MKRIFILGLAIMAASAVFAQQGGGSSGTLKDITGTVEMKRNGQGDFVPAKNGDAVDRNTIISTGFKSTAVVVTGTASIFVRPLTRLTLEELVTSQGSEQVNASLQTGRVRVEVKPPAGTRAEFTIKSPSATASVRGTEFGFDPYSVTVDEGTVAYAGSKGRPQLVSAGESSSVSPAGGRAADPVEAALANLTPPGPSGTGSALSGNVSPPSPVGNVTIEFVFE